MIDFTKSSEQKCGICSEVVEKDHDGIWISCDTIDEKAFVHRECYEKMLEKFDVRTEHDDRGRDE